MTKCYSGLRFLETFEERFEYLKLSGIIGNQTFGFDRWLNQMFYRSQEWRDVRREVILRDEGCDLGDLDHPIHGGLLIHHMNPMSPRDVQTGAEWILDPEYLITTCHRTHNALHYGGELPTPFAERRPGDTKLW